MFYPRLSFPVYRLHLSFLVFGLFQFEVRQIKMGHTVLYLHNLLYFIKIIKILINIQGVPFLFVQLQTKITQRLKMINAICKREKTASGRTIFLMKLHLSILIIKVTSTILVKDDSISKQT